MVQYLRLGYSWWRRNRNCILLAFCWMSGLVSGFLFYTFNQHTLSSLMLRTVFAPVSIVGLLLSFLLPFLFSAFAVIIHTPIWIYPISCYKAFSFAVVSIGLVDGMGSAGWLYWILLLAVDILSLPALYLYWLHSLMDIQGTYAKPVLFLVTVAFPWGCVNTCFLLRIMSELGNR